jgi:NTE family protein
MLEADVDIELDGTGAAPPPTPPVRYRKGVRRPRWSGYTAFVLSGGGARGAMQVGMLRALLERGERPDVVVGTSIGAWNGSWLARNPTLDRLDELVRIWHGLTPAKVLLGYEPNGAALTRSIPGMLMLAAVRRMTQGYASLYPDAGTRQLAMRLIGDATFEDLPVPLRIVATDLTRGTRAIFGSGPLVPAVIASSAIPGIFPPVRIGGHLYVDGGALDNASLDVALDLGARRMFVLNVGYNTATETAAHWAGEPALGGERVRGNGSHPLAGVLERTTQVVTNYQLDRAVRRLPPGIEFHLIRPLQPSPGGTLDFGRSAEWIEQGYAIASEYLRTALPPDEPELVAEAPTSAEATETAAL